MQKSKLAASQWFATLIACLALSAISLGQKSDVMSPQFKEQARKAFRAVERLDFDDNRYSQLQAAHRAVNGLVDTIKTPLDKNVFDILFAWLAEIERARRDTLVNPSSARSWINAEAKCQTEAMFYLDPNGLTEEGRKNAAQHVAEKACVTTAKGL
jgi:hypothetical protein